MTPRHRAYLRVAAERGDASAGRELIADARARARHEARVEAAWLVVGLLAAYAVVVLLLGIHP